MVQDAGGNQLCTTPRGPATDLGRTWRGSPSTTAQRRRRRATKLKQTGAARRADDPGHTGKWRELDRLWDTGYPDPIRRRRHDPAPPCRRNSLVPLGQGTMRHNDIFQNPLNYIIIIVVKCLRTEEVNRVLSDPSGRVTPESTPASRSLQELSNAYSL